MNLAAPAREQPGANYEVPPLATLESRANLEPCVLVLHDFFSFVTVLISTSVSFCAA